MYAPALPVVLGSVLMEVVVVVVDGVVATFVVVAAYAMLK